MAHRSAARRRGPSLTVVMAVGITLAALYFAQEVLVPIVLAVLLSFLLAPVCDWLERWRLGRVVPVLITVGLATVLLAALGWIVADQFVSLVQEQLPSYREEIVRKIHSVKKAGGGGIGETIQQLGKDVQEAAAGPATTQATQPAGDGGGAVQQAQDIVDDPSKASREVMGQQPTGPPGSSKENPIYTVPAQGSTSPLALASNYLGFVLGPIGTFGIVLVFTVFMLLERESLRDRLLRLISRGKYTTTTTALTDAGQRISRYLTAQMIVNGTYGLAIGIGLLIIGLIFDKTFPSFVLWALLCTVLRFIPYIGPWIAAAFPILLSIVVYPGFGAFFATVGMFVVIELISNNVIEPWLYGSSTGMSTTAVLVSAVFWTWMWGPIGLLLATPLTVIAVVIGKHVPQFKFLDVLLGDQPALSPHISYYQRLLAEDKDGAAKILDSFAEEKSLADAPDELLIPALSTARRDRRDGDLPAEQELCVYEATDEIIRKKMHHAAPPEDASLPLVLGCAAHHVSEELVLRMIDDVITEARFEVLSTRMLPSEIESRIAADKPAILLITVVPPGGLTQARYLCRRLRRRFPDLCILIGYMGKPRDFDMLLKKMRGAGAHYLATSVNQCRSQIKTMLTQVSRKDVEPQTDADVRGLPA